MTKYLLLANSKQILEPLCRGIYKWAHPDIASLDHDYDARKFAWNQVFLYVDYQLLLGTQFVFRKDDAAHNCFASPSREP